MPTIIATILVACSLCTVAAAQNTGSPADLPLTKNPTTAVLYSLAFPGAGQLYTERYWKVPIFAGAAITTAYLTVSNHAQFVDLDRQVQAAIDIGENAFTIDRLRRSRDVIRQNRDVSGALFLATYLIAAVDAYVGAHLYDFNVDESLSLRLGPTSLAPIAAGLAIRW